MNCIDGNKYIDFLGALKAVCQETKTELQDEMAIDQILSIAGASSMLAPSSLEDVAKKVSKFVGKEKDLMLYEAAKRVDLDKLANVFLLRWKASSEEKLNTKFAKMASRHPSQEEYETKLDKIAAKIVWPCFRNKDLENREAELMGKITHILSKELIFTKFASLHQLRVNESTPSANLAQVPAHVAPFISTANPDINERVLINKYADLVRHITFSQSQRCSDKDVSLQLRRFKKLETLDVSGCIRVTSDCFKEGHPTLKTLVLEGTRITRSEISAKNFPKLEDIRQSKPIDVYDLAQDMQSDWKKMADRLKAADELCYTAWELRGLLQRFASSPSLEGIKALLALSDRISRIPYSFADFRSSVRDFDKEMIAAFFNAWERADWKKGDVLGAELAHVLLEMSRSAKPFSDDIKQRFLQALSLTEKGTREYGESYGQDRVASISEADVKRLRHLLSAEASDGLPLSKLEYAIRSRLEEVKTELFYCESLADSAHKPRLVYTRELLNEIYLEISHREPLERAGPFQGLINPARETRRHNPIDNFSLIALALVVNPLFGTTYHPGPLYSESTDQILACAFAFRLKSREKREEMLEAILSSFSGYVSTKEAYPLAKLILGVTHEEDIPACDKGSVLERHLFAYKGIFSENISAELQQRFWDALCQGKLGGRSLALVQGLADFYDREDIAQEWKDKAIVALKKIAGIIAEGPVTGWKYRMPSSDPVTLAARQKLTEISV